jgi:hypothetical protein
MRKRRGQVCRRRCQLDELMRVEDVRKRASNKNDDEENECG